MTFPIDLSAIPTLIVGLASTMVGGYFIFCFVDDGLESFQQWRAGVFTRESWWALVVADFGTQHMILLAQLALGAAVAAVATSLAGQAVPNVVPLGQVAVAAALASITLTCAGGMAALTADMITRVKAIAGLGDVTARMTVNRKPAAPVKATKAAK